MDDVMLGAARVRDPTIAQLMATAQNAAVFQLVNNKWERTYEGSFMLFNRDVQPQYGFLMLDRNRPDFLVELLSDGASVMHEVKSDQEDKSNTVRYTSANDVEYLIAFESVAVALSIYQKLKQATLLVGVSRRGNDRRASQPARVVPAGSSNNGANIVLNGSAPVKTNGKQKKAEDNQDGAENRVKGIFSQLLAAKANYVANHVPEDNNVPSPANGLKKRAHASLGVGRTHEKLPDNLADVVTPNRNPNASPYYAKPSAPTVSLNPLSGTNGSIKSDGKTSPNGHAVEVQNGIDTDASPSKTSSATLRTLPISLNQLFGNANGLGSAKKNVDTAVISPSSFAQSPKVVANGAGLVADSSSTENFSRLQPFTFGMPTFTTVHESNAQRHPTDTASSNSNGNWASEDELAAVSFQNSLNGGKLPGFTERRTHDSQADTVDSDSVLIAPDAFVASDADENRVLLDMVMMSRTGRGTATEQATDMRVEDRSRTETASGSTGEPSSTTANDDVASRSRHSSACSNSARSKSNSKTDSSESSPQNDQPVGGRRTRKSHAFQLTKEQLRATLVDLLENDNDFVQRLHQNYTRLLLRPHSDAMHSTK